LKYYIKKLFFLYIISIIYLIFSYENYHYINYPIYFSYSLVNLVFLTNTRTGINPRILLVDLSLSCKLCKFLRHKHTHKNERSRKNAISKRNKLWTELSIISSSSFMWRDANILNGASIYFCICLAYKKALPFMTCEMLVNFVKL
jgi:hypothetical protein